jgi:hypothetical protein
LERYKVAMQDPLAPTAGVMSRLVLATALTIALWLAVLWAL